MEETVPKPAEIGEISSASNSVENNNIQCSECGKLFKTKPSFKTHFYNFHKTPENESLQNKKPSAQIVIRFSRQTITSKDISKLFTRKKNPINVTFVEKHFGTKAIFHLILPLFTMGCKKSNVNYVAKLSILKKISIIMSIKFMKP